MNFHQFHNRAIASFQTFIPFILILILIGSSLSCGIVSGSYTRMRALLGGKVHIKTNIVEKANQNSPVALDLLVIYDENLLAQLLNMSAKEWFEKRTQIKRDHLEGRGLDYWGWEWVPGQKIPDKTLPLKSKAKGGIIFAGYFSLGPHRATFDPFGDMTIHLLENGFTVEVE